MFKQAFLRKHSIVVTWLLSYVTILFVPILIGGILYVQALQIVQEEINRSNDSLLLQIRESADHKLKEIERLGLEISMNRTVNTFVNSAESLTDEDHYEILTITKDLAVYKLANDMTDELYIYYKNSNTLISSDHRVSGPAVMQTLKPLRIALGMDWQEYFDQRYVKGFSSVIRIDEGAEPERWILYARSILLQNPQQPGAMIMFLFDSSKLLSHLQHKAGTQVLVLNQQGHIIASDPPMLSPDFLTYRMLAGDNGILDAEDGGEEVTISYQTSGITGWKYVTITKADVFFEKVEYLRNLVYLGFIVCLVIGTAITYLSLRRNYNPIQNLITAWSQRFGLQPDAYANEYEFIRQAMNHTVAEKDQIYERLKLQNDVVRSNFLNRLLKGRLETSALLHESLEAYAIDFNQSHFSVLLIRIEDKGKFSNAEASKSYSELDLLQFVISNVMEELFREQITAYTVEADYFLACIVNGPLDMSMSLLEAVAAKTHSFIHEYTYARLTTSISSIHRGLAGIPLAYQEALEALEYRFVVGSGGEIITYESILEKQSEPRHGYYYPLQVEQQLINYLKIGDYEQVSAVFVEWTQHNFTDANLPAHLARCLMSDFASTIMKTVYELDIVGKEDLLDRNKTLDRLLTCTTVIDMKEQMMLYLQEVCDGLAKEREANKPRWYEEIAAFVHARYADSNLNISLIGEHYGMTPSYISKRFKDESGEALLEFINRLRIEEAKRLLRTHQEQPINEISRVVGYSEINTFNRVFKKLEGVTPGQYKEMHVNSSKE